MKKFLLLLIAGILSFNLSLRADEGMWIPMFIDRLNYADMQKLGLKLTPEEIYSVNHSSLKDAVVIFGGGCTGEIVSPEGLLFTNHHCGYGSIQAHSSIEHDYLSDGFWAMNKDEELPNEGLKVQFLIRIEDVTQVMQDALAGNLTEDERSAKIREVSDKLVKKATEDTPYNASVKPYFGGNEFYLLVYITYKDVRLVGTPPSSIGKFGGDTDNWMWPRHTGDFSIFRVYTAPDGSPAEYSKDNIPLNPKHYLPISLDGYHKGTFAMILGYPGSTDRYLSSWGVNMAINIKNPSIVKVRREKLDIIGADMAANPEVRIQYASKYAGISNYWKYYIGETKGLKRLKVYDKKVALEKEFQYWANQNKERSAIYGNVLGQIEDAYRTISKYALANAYYREAALRGPEIFGFAYRFRSLAEALKEDNPDQEKIGKMVAKLRESAVNYFKNYHQPTDEKITAAMMKLFQEDVPADQQPAYMTTIADKYKGDYTKYAAFLFKKSVFASPDKVNELLDKPSAKKIENDPAYLAFKAFLDKYRELRDETAKASDELDRGNRFFIAGLREMEPNKKFYPDANFTMRMTYGTVEDYYPADAVHYNYYTTLEGVMEKEDPSNPEFVVPQTLKDLYKAKDYGQYGEDGQMHTCFISNLDITGGNSGSPVMNGNGELIGLAFDGNWEAMSGDIAFEPELQRTIAVDIRYVLFIIDKFAGAKNLISELTLVKDSPKVQQNVPVFKPEMETAPVNN